MFYYSNFDDVGSARSLFAQKLRRSDMFSIFESKNVPPYDIKGSGTPTTGNKPIVIPMFINICKKIFSITPAAASLAKWLSIFTTI